MQFADTHLPEDRIFQDAFKAGWARYVLRFGGETERAAGEYLCGPVALARLILEHGGDCRQTAAAACLAGPAVFSQTPAENLNPRLRRFAGEITEICNAAPEETYTRVAALSADARLFFQACAILLMEQLVRPATGAMPDAATMNRAYLEALKLYSAARGAQDTYSFDTRFEIAAMKVTTFTDARTQNIWHAQGRAAAAPAAARA
jgi:hypothetical protein